MSDESTMKAIRAKLQVEDLLGPWDDTSPKPNPVPLYVQELLGPWGSDPKPHPIPLYIQELNAETAIGRAQAEENKRAAHAVHELAPLDERLKKLLARIPLAEQREGLSLSSLQASLKGRQREHAHAGEVGAALRRANFYRVRRWTRPDGFRAVWRKRP